MKLFDAIRLSQKSRTPAHVGRIQSVSEVSPVEPSVMDSHWRVRHEVTIGFENTGPEESIPQLKTRAIKAISREVFGEIQKELLELRSLLWEENIYRDNNNPILNKLENLIMKTRS
jgi:hypothetical protein